MSYTKQAKPEWSVESETWNYKVLWGRCFFQIPFSLQKKDEYLLQHARSTKVHTWANPSSPWALSLVRMVQESLVLVPSTLPPVGELMEMENVSSTSGMSSSTISTLTLRSRSLSANVRTPPLNRNRQPILDTWTEIRYLYADSWHRCTSNQRAEFNTHAVIFGQTKPISQ